MAYIVALIMIPCIAALALLLIRGDSARDIAAIFFAAVIALTSVLFAGAYLMGNLGGTMELPGSISHALALINIIIELVVSGYVIAYSLKYRRALPLCLACIQLITTIWFEYNIQSKTNFESAMYVDGLSVIMVLIIGIVGSGICVYALGYMKDWQHHQQEGTKDRRPWFFAIMFAFLSAMFNIVLSDNLCWMYTAWEVTTLCSFLLIGFAKTPEAMNNAFIQIILNMVGGTAFQAAIVYLSANGLPTLMTSLIAVGEGYAPALLALPLALLAFAGLTKAAQMPFHKWLLGAMVAPTPTSALLHSSTMVKAGCFLLIRLAPLFLIYPFASNMVIYVGGITFCICSVIAITQTNAKRVLAYSTIANLGLITACAGVGTPEAVWAAIFLVIFHAVAKSLLFLCVGTAEHHIGSRNIEDMDELFNKMPKLARLMMLGIMGMFVAPFGMLISKWATLVSMAQTGNLILLMLIAFGSAATFMFWAKWMGKLAGVSRTVENIEGTVHKSEWTALGIMATLVTLCCVLMPVISSQVVVPYVDSVYGMSGSLLSVDNLYLMGIICLCVVVVLFASTSLSPKQRVLPIYLSGASIDNENRIFKNSLSQPAKATGRNWYLSGIFSEDKFSEFGSIFCLGLIVLFIMASMAAGTYVVNSQLNLGTQVASFGGGFVPFIVATILFAILGPVLGCLIDGLDRKISARMQGRVGPPLLQPYYDVVKLLGKERGSVNNVETVYIAASLACAILSGGCFFSGCNILACIFLITLAVLFYIVAAYSARSPFAEVGADREVVQVMSYEPMVLFLAVGFYLATGSFDTAAVFALNMPIITKLILVFIGLLFILTIKLHKSPFDLSSSHHAHQELVRGMTTEMSGRNLAMVEIMHWSESVLFLGWVGIFFVWGNPASIVLGVIVAAAAYFLEIVIDNNFARVKWQACLKWAWIVAGVAGFVNLGVLIFF